MTPTSTPLADRMAKPKDLHFDLQNPRSPDEVFEDEQEVLTYLLENADVDELVQSILSAGWLDYEPMIVLTESNTVLEGNRRLAALRLIEDLQLRESLGYVLPVVTDSKSLPSLVRVKEVSTRREARAFIGFKHINGPFKWDALAKAKFAAEWLHDEQADLTLVSRKLGDNHNTVRRLVNGWVVLQQALREGFRREQTTKKSFPFSHLYTALARPSVRAFLGLPSDDSGGVFPKNPVPVEFLPQLREFMSWLYGQKTEPSIIFSQNPDLNRVVDVLGNSGALAMLRGTRDLARAYEVVEDKGQRFSQALMATIRQAEEALRLVANYDGEASLMSAGENLVRTSRALRDAMRRTLDDDDIDDGSRNEG
jgi:hypothetical protein